jgi:hypothetical protein
MCKTTHNHERRCGWRLPSCTAMFSAGEQSRCKESLSLALQPSRYESAIGEGSGAD